MGTRSPQTPRPISSSRDETGWWGPRVCNCHPNSTHGSWLPAQPSHGTGVKAQTPRCRCAPVWPLPGPEAAAHLSHQPGERLLSSSPGRSCSFPQGACRPHATGKGHKGGGERGPARGWSQHLCHMHRPMAGSPPSSKLTSAARGIPVTGQAAQHWDS